MLINCETCSIRSIGCSDCVVNLWIDSPTQGLGLLPAERAAVQRFVKAGLVAPFNLPATVDISMSESA